jgi:hypothetical protein
MYKHWYGQQKNFRIWEMGLFSISVFYVHPDKSSWARSEFKMPFNWRSQKLFIESRKIFCNIWNEMFWKLILYVYTKGPTRKFFNSSNIVYEAIINNNYDAGDVTLSVYPKRASLKICLATVGIKPTIFAILAQCSANCSQVGSSM